MPIIKTIATALIAVSFSATVFAQKTDIVKTRFISVQGGFTIDLPYDANGGVLPIGNAGLDAGTYSWTLPDGRFTVGFVEGVPGFSDDFALLNDFADSVTSTQIGSGATVESRIEMSQDGHPGIELRIKRKTGFAVNRCILVRNRLYILMADFARAESEPLAVSVLDSFELIERGSLVA